MELRSGEVVVQCAGGKCSVCKKPIPPGPAIQLSAYTSGIRHTECMPKTDSRSQKGRYNSRKRLAE